MSNLAALEELKDILGENTFHELVQKLSGRNIYIPKRYDPKYPNRQQRDKLIREDYYANMAVSDIAAKYGLSEDRIYKILARE